MENMTDTAEAGSGISWSEWKGMEATDVARTKLATTRVLVRCETFWIANQAERIRGILNVANLSDEWRAEFEDVAATLETVAANILGMTR